MADILIHSPFPRQDGQGNSTTADRLEHIFVEAGFEVSMEHEWYSGGEADYFIALNARRSAGAVEEFRDNCPDGKVIVVLTGTDINHTSEMADKSSATRHTMQMADNLVVLHDASLALVSTDLHHKCHTIFPSVTLPKNLKLQDRKEKNTLKVVMAGNVRIEKNIPLAIAACGLLPKNADISVLVYGSANGTWVNILKTASQTIPAFQWMDNIPHQELIETLATSDLLLNTSTQEGGANAICEAISLGLPVIASRISGNRGMLGEHYTGYFPSEDPAALAQRLTQCAEEPSFLKSLQHQVSARAPLFTLEEESRRWIKLIHPTAPSVKNGAPIVR